MTDKNKDKQKGGRKAGPGRTAGIKDSKPRGKPVEVSLIELDSIDRAMLKLEANQPKISNLQMKEILGVSDRQAAKRRKRRIYQDALIEMHKPFLRILQDGKAKAARKLVELVESGNSSVELSAATALLKPHLAETINLNVSGGKLDKAIDSMNDEQLQEFIDKGVMSVDDDRTKDKG